jgi:hypothetical protein
MTEPRISLRTADDILGAIPALLGFTPENSVVVIALAASKQGSQTVAALARIDSDDAQAAAERAAAAMARQHVDGADVTAVILVAVADTAHAGAALVGLAALRAAFAARAIDTVRALHAYNLRTGTIYTDLDNNTDGTVPDPTATVAAATMAVHEGTVIGARREDIAARFTPSAQIPAVLAFAAATTMGADFLPVTYDELAAVIGAREIPSADLTARVGLILATGHLDVRDAFLSMAVHGTRDAADVFTHMAAALAGTARAQALTIAALFLYSAGNGAAANMAIDAATSTAAASGVAVPSLTTLLTTALGHAAPPALIDQVIAAITPEYVAEHIGRVQSYT